MALASSTLFCSPRAILSGDVVDGSTVRVDASKDELKVEVEKPKRAVAGSV